MRRESGAVLLLLLWWPRVWLVCCRVSVARGEWTSFLPLPSPSPAVSSPPPLSSAALVVIGVGGVTAGNATRHRNATAPSACASVGVRCSTCLTVAGCGWCAGTVARCLAGTAVGPADPATPCEDERWWIGPDLGVAACDGLCGTNVTAGSCESCAGLDDDAFAGDCVWCPDFGCVTNPSRQLQRCSVTPVLSNSSGSSNSGGDGNITWSACRADTASTPDITVLWVCFVVVIGGCCVCSCCAELVRNTKPAAVSTTLHKRRMQGSALTPLQLRAMSILTDSKSGGAAPRPSGRLALSSSSSCCCWRSRAPSRRVPPPAVVVALATTTASTSSQFPDSNNSSTNNSVVVVQRSELETIQQRLSSLEGGQRQLAQEVRVMHADVIDHGYSSNQNFEAIHTSLRPRDTGGQQRVSLATASAVAALQPQPQQEQQPQQAPAGGYLPPPFVMRDGGSRDKK